MGSSQTRAQTRVPCIGRRILNHCTTREVPIFILFDQKLLVISWSQCVMNLIMPNSLRDSTLTINVWEYWGWTRFILSFFFLLCSGGRGRETAVYLGSLLEEPCSCHFGKRFPKMQEACFRSWGMCQGPERAATATSCSSLLLIPGNHGGKNTESWKDKLRDYRTVNVGPTSGILVETPSHCYLFHYN